MTEITLDKNVAYIPLRDFKYEEIPAAKAVSSISEEFEYNLFVSKGKDVLDGILNPSDSIGFFTANAANIGVANDNGFILPMAEVLRDDNTPILQPINLLHEQRNIGVIVGYTRVLNGYEEDGVSEPYVKIGAVIWKRYSPYLWSILKDEHENGSLFVSFEYFPEKSRCTETGDEYVWPQIPPSFKKNGTPWELVGGEFGAVAMVPTENWDASPANKQSYVFDMYDNNKNIIKKIGSTINDDDSNDDGGDVFAFATETNFRRLIMSDATKSESLTMKVFETLTDKVEAQAAEITSKNVAISEGQDKIADAMTAVDDLKASLAVKDSEIESLSSKITEKDAEIASAKEAVEAAKTSAEEVLSEVRTAIATLADEFSISYDDEDKATDIVTAITKSVKESSSAAVATRTKTGEDTEDGLSVNDAMIATLGK